MTPPTVAAASRPALPRAIWILGLVSLFMDISSELIHSLLPVFMASALAASALQIGLVDGLGEATALLVKVFSGALSDRWGRRKPLAVMGYGLGALSKPLFALSSNVGLVLFARMTDRVGKGLRGAPRDALIADLAPAAVRGAAFGLRQSLDTVGAFVGPLLAVVLMLAWHDNFRLAFAVAIVPGLVSVALLVAGIREPEAPPRDRPLNPISREQLARLPARYWSVVAVGAVFTLARFSEAFLVLKARQTGVEVAYAPLVLVGMNVVYSLAAYPFGRWSDTLSHRTLLQAGIGVLLVADVCLVVSTGLPGVALGVGLWGLHLAMTQGLLATMVAEASPPELRGTAFGLFNLASGLATLVASALAGLLWDHFGASATFAAGAGFCALTVAAMIVRAR